MSEMFNEIEINDKEEENEGEGLENEAKSSEASDRKKAGPAEEEISKDKSETSEATQGEEAIQDEVIQGETTKDETSQGESSGDLYGDSATASCEIDVDPDSSSKKVILEEADSKSYQELKKPDEKDLKISLLNEKYLRLFAEFENFRKRNEAEKSDMFAEGERTVILRILPLLDNFERALATVPSEDKGEAFAKGIEKVYKAFSDELKNLGVTPIKTVGEKFDSSLHNAVLHVEDENAEENTIVEELQKGYMFKDKVLRYPMVKVAN